MSIFTRNSGTTFDAAEILGADAARVFDRVAVDGFMAKALSNVNPRKVKEDTIALVGITGDNSLSAYGDPNRNYDGSLQPALGAAHDKVVLDQLLNAEEGVATLVTFSLVDSTLVYGLTPVNDVVLLGSYGGKKVKAGALVNQAGQDLNPADVLSYDHMTTHFPMTRYTKLRDRVAQQGVALVGEALKWKNLGRTVNATGVFIADGLDMGSDLDAHHCVEIMTALGSVGFYGNYGALIGNIDDALRRNLLLSIGHSGIAGRGDITETDLQRLLPTAAGLDTEELIGWYMAQQGLANSVDEDLFLSRSTRPGDIAVTAGQLSMVVQQASVLMDRG
jgi:hypothetical protein